jgi:hypothetical protein
MKSLMRPQLDVVVVRDVDAALRAENDGRGDVGRNSNILTRIVGEVREKGDGFAGHD